MLRAGGFEHEKENGLRERDPRCLGRRPEFAAVLGCVKIPALREEEDENSEGTGRWGTDFHARRSEV